MTNSHADTRGLCALVQVAANLLTDDVLMRSYQLTPEYRPLVDLYADVSPVQATPMILRSFLTVTKCLRHRHYPEPNPGRLEHRILMKPLHGFSNERGF